MTVGRILKVFEVSNEIVIPIFSGVSYDVEDFLVLRMKLYHGRVKN